MKKKLILRIICIILVVLWMVLVFMLSNEQADDSSETSGNVIRWIVTIFNPNITEENLKQSVEILQPIIRKLAHFTLYTIGGLLITIMFLQFKANIKQTKTMSFLLGTMYAVTDEIHQLFVPGRSGELRDVAIDSSGVLLGVVIVSLLVYIKGKIKGGKKENRVCNKLIKTNWSK